MGGVCTDGVGPVEAPGGREVLKGWPIISLAVSTTLCKAVLFAAELPGYETVILDEVRRLFNGTWIEGHQQLLLWMVLPEYPQEV